MSNWRNNCLSAKCTKGNVAERADEKQWPYLRERELSC